MTKKRGRWVWVAMTGLGLCLMQTATVGAAEQADVIEAWSDPSTLRPYWKTGLGFESVDKNVQMKLGGRIQIDFSYYDEDNSLPTFEDGVEIRRARLYTSGVLYDRFNYKAQYDFAGGDADFKDLYIGLQNLPTVGNLRIGHFKEPFHLEQLTSSKYVTQMERSLTDAASEGRNTGIALFDEVMDKRMTWAGGAFYVADEFGDSESGDSYSFTGRLTGLPWYQDKDKLLHLGAAYSYRNVDEIRLRLRPSSHRGERLIETDRVVVDPETGETESIGGFPVNKAQALSLESAVVYGPASVQGEWIRLGTDSSEFGDPAVDGWYIMASYFLTGEYRPYKAGVFSRVKPKHPWLGKDGGGPGAWEVAARYATIDADEAPSGGKLSDVTLTLNWYPHTNGRVILEYVYADLDSGVVDSGNVSVIQARFQVDF